MREVCLEIVSNEKLNDSIYLMTLKGDLSDIKNPGEFVEVKLDNYYLRRPISVCDYTNDTLKLLYKVLGHGTKDLTKYESGHKLSVIVGLGNGFTSLSSKPLIVAGGIGVAPFFNLVKEYNKKGIKPIMVYGEQTRSNLVLLDFFKENTELYLVTNDGTTEYKGNPLDVINANSFDYDAFYACGPLRMLEALGKLDVLGYVSLEARMACGFGACMGCSIKTTNGNKRVCKEGPVFTSKEVLYE